MKGDKEKALEILRQGLKEYPNGYYLMLEIMYCLGISSKEKTEDERKEIIYLGEKILAKCTDDDCRYSAIRLLSSTYSYMGEAEKAEKLALKMPATPLSRDNLLRDIYSGNKRFKQIRWNIFQDIISLIYNITGNNSPLDDGNMPYTTEEYIVLNKKAVELLDVVFYDKNYGSFTQTLFQLYKNIAAHSSYIKDCDAVIQNLKFAAEYAIKSDEEYNPEQKYTTLILKGMRLDDTITSHGLMSNSSMELLEMMQKIDSDAIKDSKDFIEIEERLKKYAKKR